MKQNKPFSLSTLALFALLLPVSMGLLTIAVFPSIALYMGLLTGYQYVGIMALYIKFGPKLMQDAISMIPIIK